MLNDTQLFAYKKICKAVGQNRKFFISGTAGTGKSFLMQKIVEEIGSDRAIICALSGRAAQAINGKTIHYSFEIPFQRGDMRSPQRDYSKILLIIIDEISMVCAEFLDFLEIRIRECKNSDAPFGGCTIVFVGDLLQLGPVGGKWIFSSKLWSNIEFIELTRNMRQVEDPEFAEMLQRWRIGETTREDRKFLLSRKCAEDLSSFKEIEKTVQIYLGLDKSKKMMLTYENSTVNYMNSIVMCTMFKGEPMYHAWSRKVEKRKEWPEKQITMTRLFPLVLKSQVMITRNMIDRKTKDKIINGQLGTVIQMFAKTGDVTKELISADIEINSTSKVYRLHRLKDAKIDTTDHTLSELVWPFRPAYACTYHKAQGQTLDHVILDTNNELQPGLFFTGASRVRTRNDLHILSINFDDIKADAEAIEEYEKLRKQ